MNAAIAQKLNVLESAIVRVEEWAHVLFVVVKGLGSRFVSKKIAKVQQMQRKSVSPESAAKIISGHVGGNVITLPNGDAKLWIKKDHLLFSVETEKTAQICWYMKSYNQTPEIREAVKNFNESYVIVSGKESETDAFREGMIARYGNGEILDTEADIARENWDI